MKRNMQVNNQKRVPGRVHFSNEDDLHLLWEVVGPNPDEDTSIWSIIEMNWTLKDK